jgi:hypothetical protein
MRDIAISLETLEKHADELEFKLKIENYTHF